MQQESHSIPQVDVAQNNKAFLESSLARCAAGASHPTPASQQYHLILREVDFQQSHTFIIESPFSELRPELEG